MCFGFGWGGDAAGEVGCDSVKPRVVNLTSGTDTIAQNLPAECEMSKLTHKEYEHSIIKVDEN